MFSTQKSLACIASILLLSTHIQTSRLSKELKKEMDLNLFSAFQPSTRDTLGYVLVMAFEVIKKSSSKITVRPYYMFTSARNSYVDQEARELFEMVPINGKLSRNFAKTNELDFDLASKQTEKRVSFEVMEGATKHQFVLKISKTPIGKNLAEEFSQEIANMSISSPDRPKEKSVKVKNMATSDLTNFFLRFDPGSKDYHLSQILMKYPIKFFCEFSKSSVVSLEKRDTVVVNLYVAQGNSFLVNLFYDFKMVGEVKQYPLVNSQLRSGFLNLPTFVAAFKDIQVLINNSIILDYLFVLDEREQPRLMVTRYDFKEKKGNTAQCTEVK